MIEIPRIFRRRYNPENNLDWTADQKRELKNRVGKIIDHRLQALKLLQRQGVFSNFKLKALVSGNKSFGDSHTIVFRDHDDVRKTLDVENYEKLYKDKRILDVALKQQFKEYSVDKGMPYQRESVNLTDTDPSMVLSGKEGLRQHKRDYAVNQLQQWANRRMPKDRNVRSPSPSSTVSRTPSPISFPESRGPTPNPF